MTFTKRPKGRDESAASVSEFQAVISIDLDFARGRGCVRMTQTYQLPTPGGLASAPTS